MLDRIIPAIILLVFFLVALVGIAASVVILLHALYNKNWEWEDEENNNQ